MSGINIGVPSETRSSSRVLKPPGGGHTDIFAPPAERPRQPRPNYNQQNSASMCEIMGRNPDDVPPPSNNGYEAKAAPEQVDSVPEAVENHSSPSDPPPVQNSNSNSAQAQNNVVSGQRGRVPPGGFSAGFW